MISLNGTFIIMYVATDIVDILGDNYKQQM